MVWVVRSCPSSSEFHVKPPVASKDTIFALSTAPGRAAIAVIRISGPQAGEVLRVMTGSVPPARLARACEFSAGNSGMFSRLVHMNPEALRAAYGPNPESTMQRVMDFIDNKRIIGVDAWLEGLTLPSV